MTECTRAAIMAQPAATTGGSGPDRRQVLAGLAALSLGAACTPQSGRAIHSLLAVPDAAAIGPRLQVRIARDFGGIYDDPGLHQYLNAVETRLVQAAGFRQRNIVVTILNTPIVNLFSGPGDRIYLTRGLLALANSESEIASLLALETAHLLLGHSIRLFRDRGDPGEALMARLPAGTDIANLAQFADAPYLRSYTPAEANAADQAAVRYMALATYNPTSRITVDQTIVADSSIAARLVEQIGGADPYSFQAKHPGKTAVVREAIQNLDEEVAPLATEIRREDYLARLQGMLMGDDRGLGVADGTSFIHPDGGFAFDVPQGFRLSVGSGVISARGPGGATLIFDITAPPRVHNLVIHVRDELARTLPMRDMEHIRVNGRTGASGRAVVNTAAGPIMLKVAVVLMDDTRLARFLFVMPRGTADSLSLDLDRTLFSFRDVGLEEGDRYGTQFMRVVRTEAGDTVENLSMDMPYGRLNQDRFRILNGLPQNAIIQPAQVVKIVEQNVDG